MSRPALSASRALDILSLMAQSPSRPLTMSELVRMTGTNIASCHAILNVLVSSGYLIRHPRHKTYRLAPAIVAMGLAAAEHDSLLASARAATEALAEKTGVEVVLTARAGHDIIGITQIAATRFPQTSIRPGQRVPLRPPVGGIFYAWADPEEQEAWIAPEDEAVTDAVREQRREAMALLRRRGFLIALNTPRQKQLTRRVAAQDMTDPAEAEELGKLISELEGLYQPKTIEAEERYDIVTISAPIFDAYGQVLYTIGLYGFPDQITGAEVLDHARTLTAACADAMEENHIRTLTVAI